MSESKELTLKELLERYAKVNNISKEQANEQLNSPTTVEELLNTIKQLNIKKIYNQQPPLNRKQRRALNKKLGKRGNTNVEIISNAAEKLNYIDLIQKLRTLNNKEQENETTI